MGNSVPELSVLLCVKDAEATIGRAVSSTLRAMPSSSELLVLDDGSTDRTHEVLGGIKDRRLEVSQSPESLGYGSARASLLERARGRFIAIMDGDDVCAPWRFRVQLREISGVDILFSPIFQFGSRLRDYRPGLPLTIDDRAAPLHLLIGNPFSHPTMLARRRPIEAAGGYRHMVIEDYDLYLRAVTQGMKIQRHWLPVLGYRVHSGQASARADYHERSATENKLAPTYAMFLQAEFGWPHSATAGVSAGEAVGVPPNCAERWQILEREIASRRLAAVQSRLVRRYAAMVLGPRPVTL